MDDIYILVEETLNDATIVDYCFNCYQTHEDAQQMMIFLSANYELSGFEIQTMDSNSARINYPNTKMYRYFHIVQSKMQMNLIKTP